MIHCVSDVVQRYLGRFLVNDLETIETIAYLIPTQAR